MLSSPVHYVKNNLIFSHIKWSIFRGEAHRGWNGDRKVVLPAGDLDMDGGKGDGIT